MRMMSPEDMKLRNVYNEIRSEIERDAQSFGGRLVDVRCTDKREANDTTYLSYTVTLDINGMKRKFVDGLKATAEADIRNAIYNAGFFSGDIVIETVGRPKLF